MDTNRYIHWMLESTPTCIRQWIGAEELIDRLYRMHLNEPLGIEILGEGIPLIRYPGDELWSGITLPMMSHGYEVRMTPLQVLNLYNAVANEGRMVKPRIIESILYYGKTIKEFKTELIDPSICSQQTLEKMKFMLEGVVENGTAKNLNNENFKIAGKTGTAQIANEKAGEKTVGSVLASDAMFPFPDVVEAAAAAGVTAIIQPGGSIRDEDSIKAADKYSMSMVFTGIRHFKH